MSSQHSGSSPISILTTMHSGLLMESRSLLIWRHWVSISIMWVGCGNCRRSRISFSWLSCHLLGTHSKVSKNVRKNISLFTYLEIWGIWIVHRGLRNQDHAIWGKEPVLSQHGKLKDKNKILLRDTNRTDSLCIRLQATLIRQKETISSTDMTSETVTSTNQPRSLSDLLQELIKACSQLSRSDQRNQEWAQLE